MNLWKQTKVYRCPACRAEYLHDQSHAHAVFGCPLRPKTRQQLLEEGQVYEPKAG